MKFSILQKYIYFFFLFSIGRYVLHADEEDYLDATSKKEYNINSVIQHTLSSIKYGKNDENKKDILALIHRFNFITKKGGFFQNLGPNGTALKNLFISSSDTIEEKSGFYVYDIYYEGMENQLFFNTQAPYSKIKVTLARYGSFCYDFCITRNINEFFNIGFSFLGLVSQREFLENQELEESDRIVNSNQLTFFSSYFSNNGKYKLLFRGSWMDHKVRETGGIFLLSLFRQNEDREHAERIYLNQKENAFNNIYLLNLLDNTYKEDLKKYYNYKPYLNSPRTIDTRKILNLYQEFFFLNKLGVYQEIEFGIVNNIFEYRNREKDYSYSIPEDIGKGAELKKLNKEIQNVKFNKIALGLYDCQNVDYFNDSNTYIYVKNEIGFKIKLLEFLFMPFYLTKKNNFKSSDYEINICKYNFTKKNSYENIFGFYVDRPLGIIKEDLVIGRFQYAFSNKYLAKYTYKNKYFDITFCNSKISPSRLALYNNKYWRKWNNRGIFKNQQLSQASINIYFSSDNFYVIPNCTFSKVCNLIFFKSRNVNNKKEFLDFVKSQYKEHYQKFNENLDDEKTKEAEILIENTVQKNLLPVSEPAQSLNDIFLLTLGTKFGVSFEYVNILFEIKQSLKLNNEAKKIIRIPDIMADFLIFYKLKIRKSFQFNFGIDCHMKSSYKADAYDIVLQQFFVQDIFELYYYPIIDLFANFRINQFSMFIRWGHINEYWPNPVGYFSSPYYPGNSMSLDIGVEWLLFE